MDFLDFFNQTFDAGSETREEYVKSPFGWVGGKSRSLEKLLPLLPYRKIFVDVCGGSGSVLLARKPCDLEVFNDRNSGIIDFYRCLKDKEKLELLIEDLRLSLHSRELFLRAKESWESETDIVQRASKWYYMVKMSFSGVGRNFGRATKGKNPFGSKIENAFPLFWPVHYRLQNVQIENLDWRVCLRDFDTPQTVFYIDPPYLNTDPGAYKHKFSVKDHKELCARCFDCKGFVAVSGYKNTIYDSFPWDEKHEWETHITAATKETEELTDKSTNTATEVLWIKHETP